MLIKTFFKPLALAALLATAGAAHATVVVYTSLAAFNAATSAQGTDTYAGFSVTSTTLSPVTRTTNVGTAYTYTIATPGDFFGAGTPNNPWLSTNDANDAITFSGFSSAVRGIGGNFFGSDITGAFAAGNVTLAITDGSGTTTQTIAGATTASFLGFVSNGPITSLVLSSVQPSIGFLWPTADNLVLARAIPEPGTYGLMALGLVVLGAVARRRRG